MKTLQKDITTPEQAERLLELGVPKVTANYYYDSRDFKPQAHEVIGHWNEEYDYASRRGYKITPLWSVGRLVEIIGICEIFASTQIGVRWMDSVDYMVMFIETLKENECIDFSKLEE